MSATSETFLTLVSSPCRCTVCELYLCHLCLRTNGPDHHPVNPILVGIAGFNIVRGCTTPEVDGTQALLSTRTSRLRGFQREKANFKATERGLALLVLSCVSLFRWVSWPACGCRSSVCFLFWFLVCPSCSLPSLRLCFTFQTDRLRALEAQYLWS